jgi:hypothetical protein
LASLVYFTLSKFFPSHETALEHAIVELETQLGKKSLAGGPDGMAGQAEIVKDA